MEPGIAWLHLFPEDLALVEGDGERAATGQLTRVESRVTRPSR
jgi:hypothetical protein